MACLRRLLVSADRLNETAIFLGFRDLRIFGCRSSASLRSITLADQRLPAVFFLVRREDYLEGPRALDDFFRASISIKEQGFPLLLLFREPTPNLFVSQ